MVITYGLQFYFIIIFIFWIEYCVCFIRKYLEKGEHKTSENVSIIYAIYCEIHSRPYLLYMFLFKIISLVRIWQYATLWLYDYFNKNIKMLKERLSMMVRKGMVIVSEAYEIVYLRQMLMKFIANSFYRH